MRNLFFSLTDGQSTVSYTSHSEFNKTVKERSDQREISFLFNNYYHFEVQFGGHNLV